MNFVILTNHDSIYQGIADVTWPHTKEYANKHGYKYAGKTEDGVDTNATKPTKESFYGIQPSWERLSFLKDVFEANPTIDWAWSIDTDLIITNFNIQLEDIVDNAYHVIISKDCIQLNPGSMLVKNSTEGRAWLQSIIDGESTYRSHPYKDNQAMNDSLATYSSIVKFVPQKTFNSFDYTLYPNTPPFSSRKDASGNNGHWGSGDFVVHISSCPDNGSEWKGLSPEGKQAQAEKYVALAIK